MERNDLERAVGQGARLTCAAAGLGVSLALAPARFVLRAVFPSSGGERWTPADTGEPDGAAAPSVPEPVPVPDAVVPEAPVETAPGQRAAATPGAAAPRPGPRRRARGSAPPARDDDLTAAAAARRRERDRESRTGADSPGPEIHVDEPWEGYDAMNVAEVAGRLRGADPALRAMVRLYEERHKNRRGVLLRTEPGY